jgi:hypothetical protein
MPKKSSAVTASQRLPRAEIPDLAAAMEAALVEARPWNMDGYG